MTQPPLSAASRSPVIVVGAGPVGLTATLDLICRGVREVILLDEGDGPAAGSRAICWSRRSLEILSRLGVGRRLVERGFTWQTGRVFQRDEELFRFDLQPEPGYGHPAFINLSQHDFEAALIERLAAVGHPGVAWRHRVTGLTQAADHVALTVETPDGSRSFRAGWVVAADGPRSTLRRLLGLSCVGRVFDERFLIADVRTDIDLGRERRFWFHPPFHPGDSALMHRQPGNIFRIDFQLGVDADPAAERQPERILRRLERVLGDPSRFELVWASVYIFQCSRLERFVHGRVLFAGDSAHQVSPFGARGGNSGVHDADNLAWKLALVVEGRAAPALLESYNAERVAACDENILHSTRATDFMSPKPGMATVLRDAVLDLARTQPFARALINSGRLSVPAVLDGSPLNGADAADFPHLTRPGAACPDAPVRREDGTEGWLLDRLGQGFVGLYIAPAGGVPAEVSGAAARWRRLPVPIAIVSCGEADDVAGLVRLRYGAVPDSFILIRPDQHVAARFRAFDAAAIEAALARALGGTVDLEEAACVA
ncbi:MAG TPA: FAD-dependent monooxygenase [Stellaceae bacterium]|nr:FAD-dependent monooxygenase [Stellaceae bacterium]